MKERICIVGYGCVLPGASAPDAYWQLLCSGRSRIRAMPAGRWPAAVHLAPGGRPEASCTAQGGWVDEADLDAAARRLGVDRGSCDRLQLMALEATRQTLAGLDERAYRGTRGAVYLGCMDVDETVSLASFRHHHQAEIDRRLGEGEQARRARRAIDEWLAPRCLSGDAYWRRRLAPAVLAAIRERFAMAGEAGIVDAACASALAAIDCGVRTLLDGGARLVVTGGIEGHLGPDTFALFTALGALAPDRCLPFDERSEGLTQGEGAVVVALQRLSDARRDGHRVMATIDGLGAASDGRSASLFAPARAGQRLACERAWDGLDRDTAAYVECHGTGTRLGDETELATVAEVFGPRPLPVGSVKALIGHTKAAAGAAGLLKAVLAIEHRVLPPSPYCEQPLRGVDGPYVSRRELPLAGGPARLGVSSFGFGGINYHLVLGRSSTAPGRSVRFEPAADEDVVIVGRGEREIAGIREAPELDALRVAPESRPQIDPLQLAATVAAGALFHRLGLDLSRLDRGAVAALSASATGLDAAIDLGHRVRYRELAAVLEASPRRLRERVLAARDRLAPLTEDSGPGILNNVVAGRVMHLFDFRGTNFNLDADLGSEGLLLYTAARRLRRSGGLAVCLAASEEIDRGRHLLHRQGVRCTLLARADYAWRHGLPVTGSLEVRHHAG